MKLTEKQKEANVLLADKRYKFYLFEGGARSGKTYLICRWKIIRRLKYPKSRGIILRYRFNHLKMSVWLQTYVPLLREYLSPSQYNINRSDYMIEFDNGSVEMFSGLDDGDRLEKIRSTEYSDIFVNEASQIGYDMCQELKARLQWIGLDTKLIMDTNPRAPSHWLYCVFHQGKNPEDKTKALPLQNLYKYLFWSPHDNIENLNPDYIKTNLETLTGLKKKRLLEGLWCESAEGAVYYFKRDKNHVDKPFPYQVGAETWCSWDFGISSSDTFLQWFQIISSIKDGKKHHEVRIIDEYVNNEKDYKHYADVVKSKDYKEVQHCGDPTGKSRDAKLESWIYLLAREGINLMSDTGYTVADMIDNANNNMVYVKINEIQCPKTVEMFENWTYKKDKDGKVVEGTLPEHNVYSHPGTAFYYFMINRFPPQNDDSVEIY